MKAKSSRMKFVTVAAQTLQIHPRAQRELLPARVKLLTETLDLDAIGVLHAVDYEIGGVRSLWVIDGQHRYQALMKANCGEWMVTVAVHIDITDDARASDLFLKLNNRAMVAPFPRFENEVRAGYPDALAIKKLIESYGFRIAGDSRDGIIACIAVLKKVYGVDKGQILKDTLDIIVPSWGRTASAVEGKVIDGLANVCATYNGVVDRTALIKKLSKYPGGPSAVLGDARGLRGHRKASLARCVSEIVVEIYNSGRRSGRLDPM